MNAGNLPNRCGELAHEQLARLLFPHGTPVCPCRVFGRTACCICHQIVIQYVGGSWTHVAHYPSASILQYVDGGSTIIHPRVFTENIKAGTDGCKKLLENI